MHNWASTVSSLVRDVRQRGLKNIEASFETTENSSAALYVNTTTRFVISLNRLTGFTLLTADGMEFSICEEKAAEELHYLLVTLLDKPTL